MQRLYTLTGLTQEDMDLISNALGVLPFNQVLPLFTKLLQQGQAQAASFAEQEKAAADQSNLPFNNAQLPAAPAAPAEATQHAHSLPVPAPAGALDAAGVTAKLATGKPKKVKAKAEAEAPAAPPAPAPAPAAPLPIPSSALGADFPPLPMIPNFG